MLARVKKGEVIIDADSENELVLKPGPKVMNIPDAIIAAHQDYFQPLSANEIAAHNKELERVAAQEALEIEKANVTAAKNALAAAEKANEAMGLSRAQQQLERAEEALRVRQAELASQSMSRVPPSSPQHTPLPPRS
jgi:hypothetical protein